MVKKKKNESEDVLFAFFASFFTILGFILALVLRRDDKYVMFYAKQGLVLFVFQIVVMILASIPIIGWFIFGPALWIIFFVVWIITWVNALSGEMKDTWIIGELARKIKV